MKDSDYYTVAVAATTAFVVGIMASALMFRKCTDYNHVSTGVQDAGITDAASIDSLLRKGYDYDIMPSDNNTDYEKEY